jgi:Kef-type K+ transport system membrane component KefB
MLQVIVVLAACKAIGWLGQRFLGQTQVVMEMVTGVILGPSLFGLFFPEMQQWLFPKSVEIIQNGVPTSTKHPSMMILYVVAQIGLVLYMFLVGLEFNTDLIRSRAKGAIGVSLAGIVAPFLLGALIVFTLLDGDTRFFASNITAGNAALYMGAAMSITAFPMLARIIYERGIAGTSLGTLALAAGATDDAVAWSLLAVVLALAKGDANYAVFAIVGGAVFAGLVMVFGKALFVRLGQTVEREGRMSPEIFVWSMLFLMLGAYITDAIGIYAVFGAFLIGAAMPRGKFGEIMRDKLEYATVGLFLPFFFVYSGLNTQINLLNSFELLGIALLILAAAVIGKGAACALAARASGESWRMSAAIGTLMNARGLMELIILNIGLQQKVITPTLFTIMVIMAIVTTLMTSPIFKRIYAKFTPEEIQPSTPQMGALAG